MAPITKDSPLAEYVKNLIRDNKVTIFSKTTCPYCTRVKSLFNELNVPFLALELDQHDNGADIQSMLFTMTKQRTVPNVFVNESHVGGCDDTMKANSSGRLQELLNKPSYDYDLIVIGGGSGGLAASKQAAKYGKRVAVFDFVKPTPIGTTWGLGGTCVNVGCIPKKLMHQAACLGHSLHDAKLFGWKVSPTEVGHDWETMKDNVQAHIGSLNWGYRVQLREKNVTYVNAYAEFIDAHTIKAVDRRGKETTYTSEYFIIATGLRPRYPGIPGDREFGITSDDLFSLPYAPGKTCVIGASYVALECAGFLKALGYDVTVMVRSIFLRGFDQDMSERIGAFMQNEGIRILRECLPTQVEQLEVGQPGRIKVSAQFSNGEQFEEEFNTILFAIGRDACTVGIGLENVGVQLNPKNGKVVAVNEQSSIPHIFGIGDILDGKPELTPVAIQAGRLLSSRLFGGSDVQCDYVNIPTTVFTPLEYGCCGYSEEDAIAKFGDENIEVYHSGMWPLEYTVAKRSENDCYVKLICLISENEKVVGFHYLGPNAGEVTQGFALGLRMGATKADFDNLIGIHPTCAEIFTTLEKTKRSGDSVKASGC
ncbi:thioredoxin reductase [Chamberlinius hualienensis]